METLKKEGVKFGLISAVVYAILLFILYFLGIDSFTSSTLRAIPWFLMLVFAFIAGVSQLKAHDGILYFPQAIVTILLVFAISEIGAVAAEYSLYNLVDTELPGKMKEVNLEKTKASFKQFENIIDYAEGDEAQILTEVEEADYNFYAKDAVLKFIAWLFIDFLFALLLAAIVRKEPKKVEEPN